MSDFVVLCALAWLGGTLIGSVIAFFVVRWSTKWYVARLLQKEASDG